MAEEWKNTAMFITVLSSEYPARDSIVQKCVVYSPIIAKLIKSDQVYPTLDNHSKADLVIYAAKQGI